MTIVGSWRTALRIAAREARRAKGRSALVIAMIALPALALSFAAATYDMATLTGAEHADRTMGTADALIQWPSRHPVLQMPDPGDGWTTNTFALEPDQGRSDETVVPGTDADLRAALPNSTVLPLRQGSVSVKTPAGLGQSDAVMVDATSPLTRGYVEVLNGRAPATTTEVALTEQAMTWLDAHLGGTVTVSFGQSTQDFIVVGQVEFPWQLSRLLLFAPDDAATDEWFMAGEASWLVDTPEPIGWDRVLELNEQGMIVTSRAVLLDPPPDEAVLFRQYWPSGGFAVTEELAAGVLIAGLALLEVVLLVGPAFAVGARRRQRQLALVAANGGTPAHVRRIVLADGVVLGALGAGAGIAAGVATAFAARPVVEEALLHARAGGYRVFPEALAAVAGLAVVTGLLAAMVPAFVTARQNVVAALAARRGATRSRKRWIAVGAVMIGLGAAIMGAGAVSVNASILLAGIVLAELGLVVCTPALVGLIARAGRVLPLAPRIALRDAGRNRAAAAPAISAVMAAVAGSVMIGMIMDSDREHYRAEWQPDLPTGTVTVYYGDETGSGTAVERAVRATLPVSQVHRVGRPECPADVSSASAPQASPDVSSASAPQASPEVPSASAPQASPDVPSASAPQASPEVPSASAPQASPEVGADGYCVIQVIYNDLCPELTRWHAGDSSDSLRTSAGANPHCDRRAAQSAGIVVDDGQALPILTGASGEDLRRARETLAVGGVVVRSHLQISDGKVTLAIVRPDPDAPAEPEPSREPAVIYVPPGHAVTTVTVPGYLLTTGIGPGSAIVSPQLVERVGLGADEWIVAATTRPPTEEEHERFAAALRAREAGGMIQSDAPTQVDPMLLLLVGAAALVTLGAAGVGTGLAAADARADLSTLAAVGASPRLRRGLSVSQAGVIAGLGSVLGSLAGIGAAFAVIVGNNQQDWRRLWPGAPVEPVLPWLTLSVVVVAVPLVAILGAGLFTRSRLPVERRL